MEGSHTELGVLKVPCRWMSMIHMHLGYPVCLQPLPACRAVVRSVWPSSARSGGLSPTPHPTGV